MARSEAQNKILLYVDLNDRLKLYFFWYTMKSNGRLEKDLTRECLEKIHMAAECPWVGWRKGLSQEITGLSN